MSKQHGHLQMWFLMTPIKFEHWDTTVKVQLAYFTVFQAISLRVQCKWKLQKRATADKHCLCITPISAWGMYIVSITHPPPRHSVTQSQLNHWLHCHTRDTLRLYKSPSNFKKGCLKAAIQRLVFNGMRAAGGCWEWTELEWMWSEATCIVIIPVSTLTAPPSAHQPVYAAGACQRKSLENPALEREVLYNAPAYPPSPTKKITQSERATLATLLGSVGGIIRMNYPSPSCDLKIAEHTKSRPHVNGCLLFACIKVKIAGLFFDPHFMSVKIVTDCPSLTLPRLQWRCGKQCVRGG